MGRAGISEPKEHQLVLIVLGIVAQRLDLNRNLVIQVLAPSLGRQDIDLGLTSNYSIWHISSSLGFRPGGMLAEEGTRQNIRHGKGQTAGRGLQKVAGLQRGIGREVGRN